MTDGQTDRGDCNIPDAFLKKRVDNYRNDWVISGTLYTKKDTEECSIFYEISLVLNEMNTSL